MTGKRHDSGETTVPMEAALIAAALAEDARHHDPEEHPTRPPAPDLEPIRCPACRASGAACPVCRSSGYVAPAVFAEYHSKRDP